MSPFVSSLAMEYFIHKVTVSFLTQILEASTRKSSSPAGGQHRNLINLNWRNSFQLSTFIVDKRIKKRESRMIVVKSTLSPRVCSRLWCGYRRAIRNQYYIEEETASSFKWIFSHFSIVHSHRISLQRARWLSIQLAWIHILALIPLLNYLLQCAESFQCLQKTTGSAG